MVDVFVDTIDGLEDLRLTCTQTESVDSLYDKIYARLPASVRSRSVIALRDGTPIAKYETVEQLAQGCGYVNLHLRIPMCGGGLASALRSQGKKSMKNVGSGDYKNLDGVRLKTLAKMKKMDELMKTLPEQERERVRMKRDKLRRLVDMDVEKMVLDKAGKFDETQYLEDSEKLMEDIRNDVLEEAEEKDASDTTNETREEAKLVEDTDTPDPSKTLDEKPELSKPKKSKFAAFYDD